MNTAAILLALALGGCCCRSTCVPACEGPPCVEAPAAAPVPHQEPPAAAAPKVNPESGVRCEVNGERGVVVMSGLWQDQAAISRAFGLLKARGIFAFGDTGIDIELIVAESDLVAARSILEADEICRNFVLSATK